MSDLLTKLRTDRWVTATWDEYIKAIAAPECEKAKGYYYNDKMRIEMPPVGDAHSLDHSIIMFAVNLFATLKGIDINGRDNCTYRKTGFREAQPDASYYIGENVGVVVWGSGIIDLDIYPPPTLVIEVANTSLADDGTGSAAWDRKTFTAYNLERSGVTTRDFIGNNRAESVE